MANLKAKHSGTRITPEIAAALADEAKRGYDLSQAARREGGRLHDQPVRSTQQTAPLHDRN